MSSSKLFEWKKEICYRCLKFEGNRMILKDKSKDLNNNFNHYKVSLLGPKRKIENLTK